MTIPYILMVGLTIKICALLPVMAMLQILLLIKTIPIIGTLLMICLTVCLLGVVLVLNDMEKEGVLGQLLYNLPVVKQLSDLLEKIDSYLGGYLRRRMNAWPGSLTEYDLETVSQQAALTEIREVLQQQEIHRTILRNVLNAHADRVNQIQPVSPVAPDHQ
jgi:hypothetical protein